MFKAPNSCSEGRKFKYTKKKIKKKVIWYCKWKVGMCYNPLKHNLLITVKICYDCIKNYLNYKFVLLFSFAKKKKTKHFFFFFLQFIPHRYGEFFWQKVNFFFFVLNSIPQKFDILSFAKREIFMFGFWILLSTLVKIVKLNYVECTEENRWEFSVKKMLETLIKKAFPLKFKFISFFYEII